jgi:hypothetical protein
MVSFSGIRGFLAKLGFIADFVYVLQHSLVLFENARLPRGRPEFVSQRSALFRVSKSLK